MSDGDVHERYETLRTACSEARHTMDQQIEKIHREDQKAVKIFRVNLLILGVLISGFSISVQSPEISPNSFVNAHTTIGLFTMILSTLIAAMAYTSSNFEMGVKPEVIEKAREMENGAFYDRLTEEYSTWVRSNKGVHEFNAVAITLAMIFATSGLILFMGGFYIGVKHAKATVLSYGFLILEMFVSVLIGGLVYYSDELFGKVMNDSG